MALTLTTTAGSSTANAYCDPSYVDGVADEIFPRPDDWLALLDDDKNRLIVQLTRRIDQEKLRGERASITQALAFPRLYAPLAAEMAGTSPYGLAGVAYEDSASIPERVKRAVAYGAIETARMVAAGELTPMAPSDDSGMASVSLGSEFSATFQGAASFITSFERMVGHIIRPILGNLCLAPQMRLLRG